MQHMRMHSTRQQHRLHALVKGAGIGAGLHQQPGDGLVAHLKDQGVPTAVYYPVPMHLQPAYARFSKGPGSLPVTERLKERVLSLPMHSDLDEATQISETNIRAASARKRAR